MFIDSDGNMPQWLFNTLSWYADNRDMIRTVALIAGLGILTLKTGGATAGLLHATIKGAFIGSLAGGGLGGLAGLTSVSEDESRMTRFWQGAWGGARTGAITGAIFGGANFHWGGFVKSAKTISQTHKFLRPLAVVGAHSLKITMNASMGGILYSLSTMAMHGRMPSQGGLLTSMFLGVTAGFIPDTQHGFQFLMELVNQMIGLF